MSKPSPDSKPIIDGSANRSIITNSSITFLIIGFINKYVPDPGTWEFIAPVLGGLIAYGLQYFCVYVPSANELKIRRKLRRAEKEINKRIDKVIANPEKYSEEYLEALRARLEKIEITIVELGDFTDD